MIDKKVDKILDETRNRAKYFQDVQTWPINDLFNYDGWLNNFDNDEDKIIACHIIDFFNYIPDIMINQMLKSAIDKAGLFLSEKIPEWKHLNFNNLCYYSFIPGENPNPTDSGHIFTRKLRDVLGIKENRIINYSDIAKILANKTTPTPIILVDDFVGSGAQCDKAWNENKFQYNNKTLKEISLTENHIFIYSPLIVNQQGYNRIKTRCNNLILTPTHIIGKEYNLFNQCCICWNEDEELYNKGVDLILRKSKELGIPFTNGRSTQDVKGFGEQGLAIAFEHGAPDAIPPIFYWSSDKWTPLIKKIFSR